MKHIKDLRYYIRKDRITKLFIIIQALIYGLFIALDIMGKGLQVAILMKFLLILICFFYVNIMPSVSLIWRMALFFTVLADVFLFLINDYYLYGLISFIIVQQLYGIFLSSIINNKVKRIVVTLFIRLFVLIIGATIISYLLYAVGIHIDGLLVFTVFYFLSILSNTIISFKRAINNFHRTDLCLFAIGMLFFILCDLNVALYNMSTYIKFSHILLIKMKNLSSIMMWTFYAPSQVLISLSAAYNYYYKHKF